MKVVCFLVFLLQICIFLCVVESQPGGFAQRTSLDPSAKYIFLDFHECSFTKRLQALSDWYFWSLQSHRELIVSWTTSKSCSTDILDVFAHFPPKIIVLKESDPLPILLNSSFASLFQRIPVSVGLIKSGSANDVMPILDSLVTVVVADSTASVTLTGFPCMYHRMIRSRLFSQMALSAHLAQKVQKVADQLLRHQQLVTVRLPERLTHANPSAAAASDSSVRTDGYNHILRVVQALWEYFSYEEELSVEETIVAEEMIGTDEAVGRFGENSRGLFHSEGHPMRLTTVNIVKRTVMQSWLRFMVSSSDRTLISDFLRYVDGASFLQPRTKWVTLVKTSVNTANNQTEITVEHIVNHEEVANPMFFVVVDDGDPAPSSSAATAATAAASQQEALEWILATQSFAIIDAMESSFGHQASLAGGLFASSFPLTEEEEEKEQETATTTRVRATARDIPVFVLGPNNVTVFQDLSQWQCGDIHYAVQTHPATMTATATATTTSAAASSVSANIDGATPSHPPSPWSHLVHVCPPSTLPWNLDGATHQIYCLAKP